MIHAGRPWQGFPPRSVEVGLLVCCLVTYGVFAVFLAAPAPVGDELRYLQQAQGLLAQGEYLRRDDPEIVNGPGYPLFLAPFLALDLPLWALRVINAPIMALAVWFLYRAALLYLPTSLALAIASLLAIHPVLLFMVPHLLAEALTLFCASGFAWAMGSLSRSGARHHVLLFCAAVSSLTWLTLTRVIFGYVLITSALALFALVAVALYQGRLIGQAGRALVILALSLLLCVPYLAHTHSLTGQHLKWSTNGAELLYWGTSTNPGELGSWFDKGDLLKRPELAPHIPFHQELARMGALEREAAYRARAWEQIRENPLGVLTNWGANLGRLAFGAPRSFHAEDSRPFVLALYTGPIYFLFLVAVLCTLRDPGRVSFEIRLLAMMTLIYLGGSSLLPATPRYSALAFPWILITIAGVLPRFFTFRTSLSERFQDRRTLRQWTD